MATIGERVRALRKARGLSQPELARLVGIAQPSLANIESDKTKTLRGNTLAGLCKHLSTSPEVLLGRSRRGASEEAALHEAELLALWRSLDEGNQQHVLVIARALAAQPKPRSTRSATTAHGELTDR